LEKSAEKFPDSGKTGEGMTAERAEFYIVFAMFEKLLTAKTRRSQRDRDSKIHWGTPFAAGVNFCVMQE